MKNRIKIPLLLSCLALFVVHSRGQLNYNFDGTTSDYFTYANQGIGELTDSTARNTFYTNGSAGSEDAAALQYNTLLALNSDWSISLTITAPSNISGVSSLSSNETIIMGINIEKNGTSSGANFDLEMQIANASGTGTNDRQFSAVYNDGFSGSGDGSAEIATVLTTATLMLNYDYTAGTGTGMLSAWYGSTQLGASYDLLNGSTGWDASAASDTVKATLLMASANIDNFNTNQPTFDNITVSAVPEPASAAALIGFMVMGVVVSRRRFKR